MRYLYFMILLTNVISAQDKSPIVDEKLETIALGKLSWAVPDYRGNFLGSSMNSNSITSSLAVFINTSLQKMRKYDVVERQNIASIVDELKFNYESGLVNLEDKKAIAAWGKLKGIKYLILGTIHQFTSDKKESSSTNSKSTSEDIFVDISLRVINIETGVIQVSDSISISRKVMSSSSGVDEKGRHFSHSSNDGIATVISKVMRVVSDAISEKIVTKLRPIQIIAKTSKEIVINYGSELLNQGDLLMVYKNGEEVKNKQGEHIDTTKVEVGLVKIIRTTDKFSYAIPYKKTNFRDIELDYSCIKRNDKKPFFRKLFDIIKIE